MAKMLEWSDHEFATTMINMLRVIMEKVDTIQEHIENVSRVMEILRKNKKIC